MILRLEIPTPTHSTATLCANGVQVSDAPASGPFCPACQSEKVSSTPVDGRSRFRCLACQKRWYGSREKTSPASAVLDELADQLAAEGQAEELALVLKNFVWPQDLYLHLDRWCEMHGFAVTRLNRPRLDSPETEPYLRFTWAVAATPPMDVEPCLPSERVPPTAPLPGWEEFAGYLKALLQNRSAAGKARLWPTNSPENFARWEQSFSDLEQQSAKEIELAISYVETFGESAWQSLPFAALEVLTVRLAVVAEFCRECSISSARETIPFPELSYRELLAWLLSDWWQDHGLEKALRLASANWETSPADLVEV